MTKETLDKGSTQERWARFRFSIIGPLLAAPPADGELQTVLLELIQKFNDQPLCQLILIIVLFGKLDCSVEQFFGHICRVAHSTKLTGAKGGSMSVIAIDLVPMVVCNTQWKAKKHPTYATRTPLNKWGISARNYAVHAPSTRKNFALSSYRRVLP